MIYQPPNSRFRWIKYYRDGECFRESTHSPSEKVAEKLLRQKLAEIDAGTFSGPQIQRTTVFDLGLDYLRDYEVSGKKALKWATRTFDKHLEPYFGKMRAARVTTDDVNKYVQVRKTAGASNSTIIRELAVLHRIFNLAFRSTPRKIAFVPTFPHLQENAPRTGFVEDAQYNKLVAANPPLYLRAMLALAYSFGFRKGELLIMQVGQVDLLNRTIRLYTSTTKSGEGRLVSFEGLADVETLLRECVRGKQPSDYLFTRDSGRRVLNFREAWYNLTAKAGIPKLLFHDLRRSAVRNMIRSGIAETVAMRISGHKTRAVFDRYNIVSETDLQQAARKIGARRIRYAQDGHTDRHSEAESGAASSQVV
jgi:integrase